MPYVYFAATSFGVLMATVVAGFVKAAKSATQLRLRNHAERSKIEGRGIAGAVRTAARASARATFSNLASGAST
jgi:hypothetical protein